MSAREDDQTIDKVRPVLGLDLGDITAADLTGVRQPELRWLPLDLLVINEMYQRSLSRGSITAIRRIVRNFDWPRLKALNVTPVDNGYYEVIDGQHTAIAAATHGGIEELPCLISTERNVKDRAGDFVGLNKDRVSMTQLQLYRAELAAGDELAIEVQQGVDAAGGRVANTSGAGLVRVGDTAAVSTLKALARTGGPAYVKRALAIGISSKLAPVKMVFLKAIKQLVWEDEFSDFSDQQIVDVIRIYGPDKLVARAQDIKADTPGLSIGRALALVIFRLAK